MQIKHIFGAAMMALMTWIPAAAQVDYPDLYVRGDMTGSWAVKPEYKLTREGDTYSITLNELDGRFKISNENWTLNYGASVTTQGQDSFVIDDASTFEVTPDGFNIQASNLTDVTIKVKYNYNEATQKLENSYFQIWANGHEAPEVPSGGGGSNSGLSGSLPVLYINVYTDATHSELNGEIIDRNLGHKNYFSDAEYWLDLNGCQWLADAGAKSVGSAEEPLPLEIKARGNYTRTGFSKKPFKLKLGKKQNLLGMSKSKHYAILAHADDNYGYLRNFTGFNLGRRIGLPWTPSQQPVEVVINGDYRGLYFLTESIRVESDRINITELDDLVTDNSLISGGYLVELDNYDEENQIQMDEKSCVGGYRDKLRITWDTPEEYSEIQKRFITDQFTAMNDGVGVANRSDDLWAYMDLDDAVRYYLVEELMSHVESYHGSTYLFRDRGEGMKWHFSPLWDFGNGFNGPTNGYFYDNAPFGCTWIASIRTNDKFNAKLQETWNWFMNNGYNGIIDDMREYADHLKSAAKADRNRWKNAPLPDSGNATPVVDNSDMDSRLNAAVNHLNSKVEWLKSKFGDYTANPGAAEPSRDTTPAAPLPYYAREDYAPFTIYFHDDSETPWEQAYAYVWGGPNEGDNNQLLGTWPGTMMEALPASETPEWRAAGSSMLSWKVTIPVEADLAAGHKVIFHGNKGGTDQTDSFEIVKNGSYTRGGFMTGIDDIIIDGDAAPAYYNLQGIRVSEPSRNETYIVVRNGRSEKVRF